MPKHLRWLATSDNDLRVARVDDRTLHVTPSRGFLPPGSLWTLRSPDQPFVAGESLQLQGVRYTVTDVTDDGRAASVLVAFDTPIDSDAYVWLRWSDHGGFEPFELPPVGRATYVPAVVSDSALGYLEQ